MRPTAGPGPAAPGRTGAATHVGRSGALGSGPLGRCATLALAVLAVDIGSKVVATAALGSARLPLGGGTFLGVVYNDSFARGAALGPLTLPATLILAALVLYTIGRICAPLAAVDPAAPRALGLVAGAAAANALDFVRTGQGVVDFIGVPTAQGAIVFNLADVAAYAGVALLARTTWRLALAVRREREVAPRYPRLHAAAELAWAARKQPRASLELVRPVPIFVEQPPADAPEDDMAHELPGATRLTARDRQPQPMLDDDDLAAARHPLEHPSYAPPLALVRDSRTER